MASIGKTAASSRPYLALGLTFLLLGVGYSNPWPLVTRPPAGMWNGQISFEVLNLYALVAFLGWAHFFYAWQGQWKASGKLTQGQRALYWGFVLVALALLVIVRNWLGLAVFSLLAWVYNIAHFVKAEIFFAGAKERSSFYSPVIAFAWFTLVLFQVGIMARPSIAIGGSLLLAAALSLAGDWRVLEKGQVRLPVLTLFAGGITGLDCIWKVYVAGVSCGNLRFSHCRSEFLPLSKQLFLCKRKGFSDAASSNRWCQRRVFMRRLRCRAYTRVELGVGLVWA